MSLLERFNAPTPKRILALDGGGIRGALTLGYLQRIEDILRKQNGDDPDFRLSDYFDMIGGTSTGSIIAACLATGMKVDDIKKMYFQLGGLIFAKKKSWIAKIPLVGPLLDSAEYDARPLEKELQNLLGDITLGSDTIKSGLCVVAKRADTNSTWPLINHPSGKYFNTKEGQNHTIPLWRAVRASAAAPTYFTPQVIDVGGDLSEAAFVDGGVSMANNPSLQMLMVATLEGFPFHWKMGKDNIFIVSVGTGNSVIKKLPSQITKGMAIKWAQSVPNMLMQDASYLNQVMLQWMSNSPTAIKIDGEIGNLENDILGHGDKPEALISYLRYNTFMTVDNLGKLMGKTYTQKEVDYLVEMSHADNRFALYDIGAKAGEVEIKPEHFPEHFKIK